MNTVISQAMATGLPVITTKHSGLPEQVVDGKNGAVVEEGDFLALADKIVFLMERDDLWPLYGRFGRKHVKEKYDSTYLIEDQLRYYRAVVDGKINEARSNFQPTTKEKLVQGIWDSHWEQERSPVLDSIKSRFTQEAFIRIEEFIEDRDRLILEAGCGTGRFCALLAKANPGAAVAGIDISANAIKLAAELKTALDCQNLTFAAASIFNIPYADSHFDVVFNEGVIPYFSKDSSPTYEDALREMIRVTKPGGKVLVGVPNWYCLPHTMYKWWMTRGGRRYEYGYEKSFTRAELKRLFRNNGLHSIRTSGFYPSYGFYRLAMRLNPRYSKLFRSLARLVDKLDGRLVSTFFGFYILVEGKK